MLQTILDLLLLKQLRLLVPVLLVLLNSRLHLSEEVARLAASYDPLLALAQVLSTNELHLGWFGSYVGSLLIEGGQSRLHFGVVLVRVLGHVRV